MEALLKLFFFHASLLLLLHLTAPTAVSASIIGATHSSPPPQHAHPEPITAASVSDLRLDDAVLHLSIPNGLLPPLASNRSLAVHWLRDHVFPLHPRAKTAIISVGNDAVPVSVSQLQFLLPAIRNLHLALRDIGIKQISVSATFNFVNRVRDTGPLLQFLEDANSSFLIRKDIKIHEFVEYGQNWGILNPNYTITKHQLDSSSAIKNCVVVLIGILFGILISAVPFIDLPDMPYKRQIVQITLIGIFCYAILNAGERYDALEYEPRRFGDLRFRAGPSPFSVVGMVVTAMAALSGLVSIAKNPDFLVD